MAEEKHHPEKHSGFLEFTEQTKILHIHTNLLIRNEIKHEMLLIYLQSFRKKIMCQLRRENVFSYFHFSFFFLNKYAFGKHF